MIYRFTNCDGSVVQIVQEGNSLAKAIIPTEIPGTPDHYTIGSIQVRPYGAWASARFEVKQTNALDVTATALSTPGLIVPGDTIIEFGPINAAFLVVECTLVESGWRGDIIVFLRKSERAL